MVRSLFYGFAALFAILAGPVLAQDRVAGERGEVVDVTASGGLIVVTDGGERLNVRIAGIRQPDEGEPLHAEANDALRRLAAGQDVALSYEGELRRDRYERAVAFVAFPGGRDLATSLVTEGWAMVYTTPEARSGAANLLALEQAARDAGLGLWADPAYGVRSADPNTLALYLDSVQIVEGRVISVGETRDRIYLNFGFDYRSDFTVSIAVGDTDGFLDAGIDLADMQDRIVRVRGWLHRRNGPMIVIDHPERLEIVGP
ncbi:thermonuclease family protein [Hyphobacterium marinum]|uniref:Thermonuclease family protein n=1 Tax=Hyphobacterium marinum TaxID=3116574 RepID=A0ABU7LXV7_9PROT|nr:thermonuclease family protein [Hyphobacterium sp. Y6023]MEE2566281.1 thermonuclease family protein [Hyphobacterium sp. Y6023]